MSTATTTNPQQRRQSGLYLRCNVCNRTYTKKEHLQRHELSHTGAKPFACQTCGRSFARQDALNRHMKLHQRRGTETSSTISDATTLTPQDSIDSQTQFRLQSGDMLIPPLTSNDAFTQPQMNATALFWPDSEDLLQNIMSIDPALWEQPMSLIPSALASHASPDLLFAPNASSTAGDEGHRAIQTLSAQLSSTLSGVTAPAALSDLTSRFLDSCLHMFFSTFVPMLPVIHRPTFVFRECSPPLLLNAIAIGSLFLGTKEASAKGDALWRLAHTAVATSWHSMINYRGEFDAVSGLQLVQTSLLSQVHAALAKSRTLRMTSQVFHGLGFYWARYCGLFDLTTPTIPSPNDSAEVKYEAWRIWLARESQLRTLLGLYILDGVISQYSGNPTHAQHMSNQLPMPSSEGAYTANDPDEWLQRLSEGTPPPPQLRFCDIFRMFFYSGNDLSQSVPSDLTFFALKVVLEGLKSLVAESKRIEPRPVGLPQQAEINYVLDRVRQYILAHPRLTMVEKRTAMLRWHAIGLDALMITARGARRLCYAHGITQNIFGGRERFETDINAERHIDKDDARRTLLHAREIHRISSQLPLGLAHDPHIPGAVFAAVTTYAAFALAGKLRIIFPDSVDWRAVVLCPSADGSSPGTSNGLEYSSEMDTTTTAFIRGKLDANGMVLNTTVIDLSYEMSSIRLLLRGLSLQWGVCTEMEEVVDAWIAKCT